MDASVQNLHDSESYLLPYGEKIETHLVLCEEKVHRLQHLDDLAGWTSVEIVDTDNQHVLVLWGALGLYHPKQDLNEDENRKQVGELSVHGGRS